MAIVFNPAPIGHSLVGQASIQVNEIALNDVPILFVLLHDSQIDLRV
jgi:hypothetical protein